MSERAENRMLMGLVIYCAIGLVTAAASLLMGGLS